MFKNMKIKKKLIVSFIICVALASVTGIATLITSSYTSGIYQNTIEKYGFAQGDIGKAMASFCRLDGNVHDAISYFDKENVAAALKNVDSQAEQVNTYMTAIEATLMKPETKQMFADATAAWKEYLVLAKELAKAGSTSTDEADVAPLQARLVNELTPLYTTVYNNLSAIMDEKVNTGKQEDAAAQTISMATIVAGIALIVVAVALSLLLGTKIANGIARPMKACSDRLARLALGNLSDPIPEVNTNDEVGELAKSTKTIVDGLTTVVNDMSYIIDEIGAGNLTVKTQNPEVYIGDFTPLLTNLRKITRGLSSTLEQIRQSAEQVSAGSQQVSTGAQALAQGATEQASAVEELSATINEIAHNSRENAKTSVEAQTHANAAGGQVDISNQKMTAMTAAMAEISKASQEIGKIIATIENIAFQTNILALNAAVEAARAGTAGKGFAVVADEVRNLASKSDQAAKATKELIEGSIRAVENGSHIVDEVTEALRKTTEMALLAVGDMGKVAIAVENEVASISQITEGIEQISAVVQTNSATSEESAAASEELSSQAVLMRQLMEHFRLLKESGPADYTPSVQESSYRAPAASDSSAFSKY